MGIWKLIALAIAAALGTAALPTRPTLASPRSPEAVSNASLSDPAARAKFDSLENEDWTYYAAKTYADVYFPSLNDNLPNNSRGTCSYVAISMLLSFYDSYWDDSFVPERYEANPASAFHSASDFSFPKFEAPSPGVAFEPSEEVSGLSQEEYISYAASHQDAYFQCELISLGRDYFGSAKLDSAENPLGMTFSEMKGFLEYYLRDVQGFAASRVAVESCADPAEARSWAMSRAERGTPVILRASSPALGCHAFVAYGRDAPEDDFYVHTGWRDAATGKCLSRVTLGFTGFETVVDAVALDVKEPHSHSYNYSSHSGEKACACSYSFPQDVSLNSGNYRDRLPSFRWKSLFAEGWFESYSPYFDFSVLDASSKLVFKQDHVGQYGCTLTREQWDQALSAEGKYYYALVRLDSDSHPHWDDCWSKSEFGKPLDYAGVPFIKPDQYGFADAYPTDGGTRENFIPHTASRGFGFETRRYRTGYIHGECVVMSPIRKGVNEAFVEYRFRTAVTRVDVELARWRPASHELLTSSNGEAKVQYYWENGWVDKLDLLAEETALPDDRNAHKFYPLIFENPVYRIRFYSSCSANYSIDGNRGRICIGGMAFYPSEYSLPLSGGELDYEPGKWNGADVENYNCYAYMLNTKKYGRMQPGISEGHKYWTKEEIADSDTVVDYVKKDSQKYGFVFEPASKTDAVQVGRYKVALFLDTISISGSILELDYHWYRQNSDGTWSHKPNTDPVKNTDFADPPDIVFDPEKSDRHYKDRLDYNVFVGYYQVTPLA